MAENLLDSRFQSFPVPALDDRRFDDLMEELRALIPVYCPEWTHHHPADPGITLLELFAYLTDVMLYRINYMPVKNLFAVLNLLGIQPRPAAAARARVVFSPAPGAHGQIIPAGSALSAGLGGAETQVFETEEDIRLSCARLAWLYASSGQSTRDLSGWLEQPDLPPIHPFGGTDGLERQLYIGDARLLTLREPGMRLHVRFEGPSAHRDLYARWRWQLFDGETWTEARLAVSHEAGEVVLESLPSLAETTVNGLTGPFLKATPLPGEGEPAAIALRDVQLEVECIDEGVLPTALFLNPGGEVVFQSLDVTRTFYPLGERPKLESSLYILARELFRAAGTRVELHFAAPPLERGARPDPSPDLELRLEYSIPGGRWGLLRTITPNPFMQPSENRYEVSDETRALKRGGILSFVVPEDLVSREVQGVEGPWIRLRLVSGQYRPPLETRPSGSEVPGVRIFDGTPAPLAGPAFSGLLLKSRSPASPAQRCISYSDFTWQELWHGGSPRGTTVSPFPHREAYTTALYLGFDGLMPAGRQRLFIKVEAGETYDQAWERAVASQRVRWEVHTPQGFMPLPQLEDQTLHLKREGYVSFQAQPEWVRTSLFERDALWLRARLAEGQYELSPRILDIRTNVVDALQGETWREERVLPSEGQPFQEVQLDRAPVLEPITVQVKERESLRSPADREALRARPGAADLEEDEDGAWVPWQRVDQLILCGPGERAFMLDHAQGVLRFGDGRHGRVPPAGPRAIRVVSYRLGGGEAGNVAAHTIQVLRESHSAVASVDNPWPAEGGSQEESLEDAAARGIRQMHRVGRAYRAEDYQILAREASGRVARAHCLEPRHQEKPLGDGGRGLREWARPAPVRVVIIPQAEVSRDPEGQRLLPGEELKERVRRYLDARRTLNVQVQVQGPRYVPVSVSCSVYLRGRLSPGTEEDIRRRLRLWMHPLTGGDDGRGWPLGGAVRRTALYQVVAACPQVLSVLEVRLFDRQGGLIDGALTLADDELPVLSEVRVVVATLS